MLDIDALLRPYWDSIQAAHGPLDAVRRAHAHRRRTTRTGSSRRRPSWSSVMTRADARAVVFPMHEPAGYPGPNDVAIAAAAASDGRLVSFCRLDPRDSPAAEARRCLDAGAVGIKLHPRAEQFGDGRAGRARDRRGRARAARADPDPRGPRDSGAGAEHGASCRPSSRTRGSSSPTPRSPTWRGSGTCCPSTRTSSSTPPGGTRPTTSRCSRWSRRRRSSGRRTRPTACRCSPPGRTRGPRCRRASATRRCARSWAARSRGSSRARTRCGSATRRARPSRALHPLLDRVVTHLISAMGRAFGGGDPDESLDLAAPGLRGRRRRPARRRLRRGARAARPLPRAPRAAAARAARSRWPARFVIAALAVARTPEVPLPTGLHTPPPTREEADA